GLPGGPPQPGRGAAASPPGRRVPGPGGRGEDPPGGHLGHRARPADRLGPAPPRAGPPPVRARRPAAPGAPGRPAPVPPGDLGPPDGADRGGPSSLAPGHLRRDDGLPGGDPASRLMTAEIVSFDLETTGLSPKSERVIEIGAVRFGQDGVTLGELQLLVDPGIPIPLPVQRLTGITSADPFGQPSPLEAMAQLAEFCEGAYLVGHGTGFDLAFCSQLLPDTFGRRDAMDTLELGRILLPLAGSHNLGALSRQLGLHHQRPHRALSDAQATAELFRWLLVEAASLRRTTFAEMHRVAAQAGTSLGHFFDLAAAERRSHPGMEDRPHPGREGPATAAGPGPVVEGR